MYCLIFLWKGPTTCAVDKINFLGKLQGSNLERLLLSIDMADYKTKLGCKTRQCLNAPVDLPEGMKSQLKISHKSNI